MAKQNNTLFLNDVAQPFDLATALRYMNDKWEFVRCQSENNDFYMYQDVQKRPVFVDGRRQAVEVSKVITQTQWGSGPVTMDLTELLNAQFTLMSFDAKGNPIWEEPAAEEEVIDELMPNDDSSLVEAEIEDEE